MELEAWAGELLGLLVGCDVEEGASALKGGVEVVLGGLPWTDTSLIVADMLVGSCSGMSRVNYFSC